MPYLKLEGGMIIESRDARLWPKAEILSAREGKAAMVEIARSRLLYTLHPGATVWTVLRHVSASGMSRRIDAYAIRDNRPIYLSGHIARLLGWSIPDGKKGIRVDGCGTDMGFHLVYSLGCALWPNGTPEPHGSRNGESDSAGGYALKHEWL